MIYQLNMSKLDYRPERNSNLRFFRQIQLKKTNNYNSVIHFCVTRKANTEHELFKKIKDQSN